MAEAEVDRVVWQARTLHPARRNDLELTSSGVGHAYTPPRDQDVSAIKRSALFPLPPVLRGESMSAGQEYLTTTGTHHSHQPHYTVVSHPENSRAAPCYKSQHNENFTYRLKERPWRNPLSIEHQKTEKQDRFRGQRVKPLVDSEFGDELRPLNLVHHHRNMALKKTNPTEPKNDLITSGSAPHDGGVFCESEHFMTKSRQVHHKFSRHQQLSLPRPNQATVYHCQQYPKAWGHGTQEPVINLHQVPQECGDTVIDSLTFKHRRHHIMPSYTCPPVRNSGNSTVMQASYRRPSQQQMGATFASPFSRMQHVTAPVNFEMPMDPQMYQTGNMQYGTAPF